MTKSWSVNWSNNYDNDYDDFSKDFLINLKDLKIFIEKDVLDDHKKLVMSAISKIINYQSSRDNKSIKMLDGSFKVIHTN